MVSGDVDAIEELRASLTARTRVIPVDYASHSHHVEEIHDELRALLAEISPRVSDVPFFSTVTASWLDTTTMDGDYWYQNLRDTVRLEEVTRALGEQGFGAFVEVSPHPGLTAAIQDTAENATVVGTLRRGEAVDRFLASLAETHVAGTTVDWRLVRPARAAADLPVPAGAVLASPGHRHRRRHRRRAHRSPGTRCSGPRAAGRRGRVPVHRAGSACAPTPGSATTPSTARSCCPAPPSSRWRCARATRRAARWWRTSPWRPR